MTTTEDLEVPADEQQAPPEDSTSENPEGESGAGESTPPTEPTAREKDLEQRLRRQGTELASARRLAAQAATQAAELKAAVDNLTARQNTQEQGEAERRERERQNYLNSLPPEKRTSEEVRLLKDEMKALKTGMGTAQRAPAPAPANTGADDPTVEYMRARAQEIMSEVGTEFEVEFSREDIASLNGTNAWDSEDSFQAALLRMAARKVRDGAQSGGNMPGSPKNSGNGSTEAPKTSQQGAGAGSPASPRAAGKPNRKPTEEDVKGAVSGYDSRLGPKANVAKLKELRARM
jgi:hypothetical protein